MGGSWAKRPVLKKTGCNRSTTGLFDFQQTGQLATGLITIHRNWQLQSSCDQLRSSPVASLCTSCQLDFETLATTTREDNLSGQEMEPDESMEHEEDGNSNETQPAGRRLTAALRFTNQV